MNNGLTHTSRYACPALGLCTNQSQQKIQNLQERISNGGSFTEKEIEEFFPNAYGKLHIISQKMKLDIWDKKVSQKYWYEIHNLENDPICQVKPIVYQKILRLKPIPIYMGNLKEGEIIITHLNTPIEKFR
ncbi:MAG: hypothetical protein V1888_00545 [archaeon]